MGKETQTAEDLINGKASVEYVIEAVEDLGKKLEKLYVRQKEIEEQISDCQQARDLLIDYWKNVLSKKEDENKS